MQRKSIGLVVAGVIALGSLIPAAFAGDQNSSTFLRSDPRALCVAVNQAFAAKWQAETGTRWRSSNPMAAQASRRGP